MGSPAVPLSILAIDARLRLVQRGIFAMGNHGGLGQRGIVANPARRKALALQNHLRWVRGVMMAIGDDGRMVRRGDGSQPGKAQGTCPTEPFESVVQVILI